MVGVTVKMELRFKMYLSFWRWGRSFQQNNNKNNHSTCFFLVCFLVVREAWLGTLCATHQRESSGEVSCLLSAVLMNTFAVAFISLFHFDRFNWIKCTRARVARKVPNLLTWCTSLYMDLLFRPFTLVLRSKYQWMSCQLTNPCVCAKISGIATGQTLVVARKKYSDRSFRLPKKKKDFGERSTLFRRIFITRKYKDPITGNSFILCIVCHTFFTI